MGKKKVDKAEAEPKVIKVRRWVFEEKTYDNGDCDLCRTNDGFNTIELLGLASLAQVDILNAMRDNPPHYDHIKRQIVSD